MHQGITALETRRVYIGTSSWKYEGWRGLVYKRSYASAKAFNENCLEEYAEHYSCVGVDHTYYAWPLEKTFQRYAEQTPASFRFGLKVTEDITVFRYPRLKRYGKRAGLPNESFLNAELFREQFLGPLAPFREKLGPLMLEFSQFHPGMLESGTDFVERLDRFFTEVGNEGVQLAVEIRNANWLRKPYFDVLEKHRVAHVFNSWTRMPTLGEQLEIAKDYKLPCLVSRVLLQPGTKYEEAVEAFSPYDKIQDPQPTLRSSAARLVKRALEIEVPAYVFVNNRAEGCAPMTIEGILAEV